MTDVYLLMHTYILDVERIQKRIGIYSTRENAERGAQTLRQQPGFKDYPNGFSIHAVELDKVSWINIRWDAAAGDERPTESSIDDTGSTLAGSQKNRR
jgi:hypothetical protein